MTLKSFESDTRQRFDAHHFLNGLGMSLEKLGLDRIAHCLDLMGNPHHHLNVIHVAGSNGKGSTVAMLEAILRQAGWKTGMTISPHLVSIHERIQVDGQPIAEEAFQKLGFQLLSTLQTQKVSAEWHPSYFEAVIVMALQWFKQQNVDVVILETGLGGRLDATNVIEQPWLSVITGISLEHTEILGASLAAIANEKAGIIKLKTPVVLGPRIPQEACEVIQARTSDLGSALVQADAKQFQPPNIDLNEGVLRVNDTLGQHYWKLPLLGSYQAYNLATVLKALEQLQQIPTVKGPQAGNVLSINEAQVQQGLMQTKWPGRFQVFPERCLIIDGSHNAEGFKSLSETLASVFMSPTESASTPLIWLVSLKSSRDIAPLANCITQYPNTACVICTSPDETSMSPTTNKHQRFHSPDPLAETLRMHLSQNNLKNIPMHAENSPTKALEVAQKIQQESTSNTWSLATGSLYTAGTLLKTLT